MIQLQKQITHLPNKEPVVIMKFVLILLLAGVCQTYMPITEQSWVNFRKVKCLTYENSPFHGEPDIIRATDILIEERLDKISTMIRKSVSDFNAQIKQYTMDITERIK